MRYRASTGSTTVCASRTYGFAEENSAQNPVQIDCVDLMKCPQNLSKHQVRGQKKFHENEESGTWWATVSFLALCEISFIALVIAL